MAKYQVNLGVTANVSQAQQSIQNLQNTLNSIANTKITVDGGSIDTAAQSARLLSEHLARATNQTTGKIDFTALSNSLKVANTDLATLSNNLLAMGPKGQQAFSQVANAVAHAELSTRKANKALQNFGVTLMNTIKWQAASSMIHGVMSAFNSAVSHIEKLDKSLNSIQIVSGKTSAEMASFAKQAQSAARALSSTTTEYSDAALIYFQQGLGEKAIAERTEATLKLAKVTGDSVATVSDQLTAIWNNFDDGSQSLEHYVDVITALGAATASSTDEIADGLQKFAAIAETVGLSYEYAATALATVTAETRQSADVVGTAFKTLFARIQGLNLGETLDDGTTLNKYSEALAKVGIDIKMSNGELKDMNDILDEMGDKWNTLNEDQQVALAQTVGGIRQYNQLIALMDNWDTFKINLDIAENSKGELDKQFEIYQSSVEASTAKLKNATESLYENLLSPDMITSFNDALTDTIDLVNTLVKNAGGIGELFKFGGLLLLQTVLPKLQGFLMSAATHIKDFVGYTKAAKMYELGTMAKTSHTIAGTPQAQGSSERFMKWQHKAETAQTTLEQGPQTGLRYGINTVRASVANAKAQAYSDPAASFMPTTQGVSGVDMDASGATMRTQMMKEEAGYTATILDTKKQILALENGLTDKQREGYKAYSDQVAKEQEALRLAREKQAVAKDTADQSSRSATMKVGSSKAGRDAKAAIKQQEIDKLEEERKSRISSLTGDKKSISKQTSEIDREYNKKKEEVENRRISNKQVDLKGEETKKMTEGFKDSDMSETGQSITQSMTDSLTQSADGSGPAASVENLEKLGQLQAQYNADAAKASGIYTELSGNIGEAGKRTEQQQKALKKTGDTMKTLGKDAKSGLVDSLKESAKQMEKTGDSAEGLKKVIKSLEDGSDIDLGDLSPKEIDAVKKSVGDLDEGLTDASASAGELAGAMAQDMANATDQDVKIFTGIAEDAQVAKASALEADGAAKQLQTTLNTQPPIIPDPFGAVVQGATQATAAFTSFAMGTQMLSTGITTAFDENASAVERVMGAMMILQGVMSTVNAVQAAANAVDTFAVAIKAAKAIAAGKEAAAESKGIIATVANTVATAANAVAKLFAAEASKGLAGVIAGVLGAALIAGTIAIVANTVATQQEAEAKQEAAAAAENEAAGHRENAEALREETAELNKNADAYRDLYKVYEETGQVKSDLTEKSYELATSLGVENASLLVLQGNYEGLNREIEKNLRLRNEEAMLAAQDSADSTGFAFATKAGQGEGYWADDGDGDGQYTTGLWADTEASWIQDFLATDAGKKYADAGIYFTDDGKLMADYDINDPSQLAYIWSMLDEMLNSKEFREYAPDSYDLTNSTLMGSYNTMKDNTGDTYTNMLEVPTQVLEQAKISGITASGMHAAENIGEFSEAYEDYLNYVAEQTGQDKDVIQGEVDEYLRNHDSYGDLYQQYDAFRSLPEEVQKYVEDNNLLNDSEAMSVILTTQFDDRMTEDEIERMIGLSQKVIDNNKLLAKVELIPELSGQLKDDMTKDEWDAWFEAYEKQFGDFEKSTGMSKEKFMGMGAEAATEFLNTFIPSPEEQQAALDNNIATWTEQKQMLIDQGPITAKTTTTLQGTDLELAKMWTGFVQENEANGTTMSAEQIQSMVDYAKSQGLMIEDAAGLLEYFNTLTAKQPYNFVGPQMDVPTFLASEAAKAEKDEQARAEAVQAETERQEQIESYDTQINQAQEEKDFIDATAFKNEVLAEEFDVEEINNYAESLKNIYDLEEDVAKEAALYMSKMNRGVETLSDNWSDWSKDLDKSKKGTAAYAKAFSGVQDAVSDLLDIDATQLSDSFFESAENLKLIEKAAEGDAEAIDTLRAKAAAELYLGVGYDLDGLSESEQAVLDSMMGLASEDLTIGAKLNETQFGQSLINAAVAAEGTVSDIQGMFESLGWEPEITTEQIPIEQAVQQMSGNGYVDVVDPLTGEVTRVTTQAEMDAMSTNGMIEVFSINGDATVYKGGGSSVSPPSGGGGGGGGSKPKKAEPTRKADVVERYKEVNDQLDDIQEAMDDANRAADKLWGANRLAMMKKVAGQMEDELDKLKEKKKLAEETYLAEDIEDLNEATDDAGVARFEFDANGDIINYDEVMGGLYDELHAAEEEAGEEWSESEQEKIDAIQERIDKVKEAQENYDATKEEIEDWQNEIEEALLAIQQQYFDIWAEGIEIDLAIDEADLAVIEYYLSKVQDDIYGIVETLTLTKQQADIAAVNLDQYQKDKAELDRLHTEINPETGETYINDAQYIEGLQDLQSKIYENLGAINEATDAYQNAYSDALAAAAEELANYTDQMEHHNSVLEHYNNLLNLTGQSKNYEKMNNVLEAQVSTAKNMAAVSKSNYDMLAEKAKEKEAAWLAVGKDPGEELTEQEQAIKNEWLAAQQAANEAQDQMLSDAEAWAEALNALLENKLANLADILDDKLAGDFGSLEDMNTAMERASSLQEEYLTTTNKIYETNKLMNTAQQEIDKTTNTVAKRRLKAYIEETEQLQNKNKLSQYELDIQQAKYDLLLAEIALEEAQDAKSTVRLQRDAEGNFGYVYTADQDAVADAEQKLADAQNALYNIGLEGANDYTEKYAATIQEMNDEITALTQAWQEGEIASEKEYQDQMAALKKYYYEKLEGYSELYGIAITTDGQVVQDAWSTQFAGMTANTEEWMNCVDEYVTGVRTAFSDWATEMEEVTAYTIGENLTDLAGKTQEIKNKSDELVTTITNPTNGVVKALEDELDAVDEVSQAYWEWYQNILSVIEAAENLGGLIADIIEEESEEDEEDPPGDPTPPTDPDPTPPADPDPPANTLEVGKSVTVKKSATHFSRDGGNGTKMKSFVPGGTYSVMKIEGEEVLIGRDGTATGWVKKTDLEGFDTGGYTGSWGPYGKLAMLHEKELVLNAHDTDNFLNTMEVMERILQMLDLQTMSSQIGGILSSPGLGDTGSQVIEQHIEIEANFPDATDRFEIEEAFKSMANLASQYANRK